MWTWRKYGVQNCVKQVHTLSFTLLVLFVLFLHCHLSTFICLSHVEIVSVCPLCFQATLAFITFIEIALFVSSVVEKDDDKKTPKLILVGSCFLLSNIIYNW